VAPWAGGQIDLRYVDPADREDVMARIGAIIDRAYLPGTRTELSIKGEFLPLTQSQAAKRLFEIYVPAPADTGFKTEGEFTGGCADSGFTAGVGVPTICAVGPVGGKARSPDEFLRIDSLIPRAQACARAVLHLEQAGL
jgi:glutamate carboxypeptidase